MAPLTPRRRYNRRMKRVAVSLVFLVGCRFDLPEPPPCGNGIVDGEEEMCDDGNRINGDGCDSNCTSTRCGNGVVSSGEECDDGNMIDGDGCEHDCLRGPPA